jgi:hypothetical protein
MRIYFCISQGYKDLFMHSVCDFETLHRSRLYFKESEYVFCSLYRSRIYFYIFHETEDLFSKFLGKALDIQKTKVRILVEWPFRFPNDFIV